MKSFIIFAASIVVIILFVYWSYGALQNYCSDSTVYSGPNKPEQRHDREGNAKWYQPRAFINEVRTDTANSASDNDKQKWNREFFCDLKGSGFALGWATIFLVIVTGGLIWIGFRQESHMRDTARKELRAYVALFDIWFDPKTEPRGWENKLFPIDGEFTNILKIRVQNYGKTPSFETAIFCKSSTTRPKTFETGDHPGVGTQMLHPGMGYTIQVNHPDFPTSDIAGWVWGHFIYQDIYKRWWRTNFFYAYQPKGLFTPEKTHNNEKGPFDSEDEARKCTEI